MAHEHAIVDSDLHFVIDPVSRSITNPLGNIVIGQYDHNSQRYTFEIPRYVEDHDMSITDRIEVHFTNITRNKKEQTSDVYIVSSDDIIPTRDSVHFSWLVSANATSIIGFLKFSISFKCFNDEGIVIYEWNTGIYDSIQVKERYQNTSIVVERNPDLFETMKKDIVNDLPSSGGEIDYSKVEEIVEDYLTANPPTGGEIDNSVIEKAVEDYLIANPPLNDEIEKAVEDYLIANPPSGEDAEVINF